MNDPDFNNNLIRAATDKTAKAIQMLTEARGHMEALLEHNTDWDDWCDISGHMQDALAILGGCLADLVRFDVEDATDE